MVLKSIIISNPIEKLKNTREVICNSRKATPFNFAIL
jgi:hypothetical protein